MADPSFVRFAFTRDQVLKNLANARKDLSITRMVKIKEVQFNYAYSALVKAGIALLSRRNLRVKSAPGHHVKIIEYLGRELNDSTIMDLGNLMRMKRNLDFYGGGVEVTEKECAEYLHLVERVVGLVEKALKEKIRKRR